MKKIFRLLVFLLFGLLSANIYSQVTIIKAVAIDRDGNGMTDAIEFEFSEAIDDSEADGGNEIDDWWASNYSSDPDFSDNDVAGVTFYTSVTKIATANVVDDKYITIFFGNAAGGAFADDTHTPFYFKYLWGGGKKVQSLDAARVLADVTVPVLSEDGAAPRLSSVTSNATSAGTLKVDQTITFTADVLMAETGLSITPNTYNGGALVWSTSNGGSTYTATYTVEEGQTDRTTALQLTGVKVTDGDSNESNIVNGTDVVKKIDANTPVINSVTSDATAAGVLIVGQTIIFTIDVDIAETGLTVSPTTYNGGSLSWSTSDGGDTYTATYIVTNGQTDRSTPLQLTGVTITDGAGNTSASEDGSDVLKTIDANKPVINSVTSDATAAGVLIVGQTITFTIDVDIEETGLTVSPTTYNGGTLSWSTSNGGDTYTATYIVTNGQTDRSTPLQLTGVTLTDGAGNISTSVNGTDVAKTIDANTPVINSVTSNATAASVLIVGQTITFTVDVATSETGLTVSPTTYNGGTLSWSTSDGGSTYTATYTVVEGQTNQTAPLQLTAVTLTDGAGNVSDAVDGSDVAKTIDAHTPVVSSVTSNATAAGVLKVGQTITFTVDVVTSETGLTVSPTTYNGGTLTWSTSDGGSTYTATYTIVEGQTDQPAPLQLTAVTLTDGAGNISASVDGSDVAKTIDANKPVINSVTSDATAAGVLKVGQTITFTVDVATTESGLTVSPTTYNGGALSWSTSNGGNTYIATYTVAEGQTDRSTPLQLTGVTLTDAAGNVSTSVNGTDVVKTIDANTPVINSVTSNATDAGVLKIGQTITFIIDVASAEPGLIILPTTYNGGTLSWSTSNGGDTYIATYTIVNGQTDQPVALQLTGVTLTDGAGNISSSVNGTDVTKTIDANSPSVSGVVFNPNSGIVGIGESITVTFSATGLENNLTLNSFSLNGKAIGSITNNSDGTYSYIYTIANGDNDILDAAKIPFSIVFNDSNGNISVPYTEASIAASNCPGIDAQRPTISSVLFTPGNGTTSKIGETVRIDVKAGNNENGLTASTFNVNGVNVFGTFVSDGSGNYHANYLVSSGNSDINDAVKLPIEIILSDGVNLSVSFTETNIPVDNSPGIDANPPVISSVISNASSDTHILKVGETITFTVDPFGSEAGATILPTSYNGGTLNWTTTNGGDTYTAIYTVLEGHTDRSIALQIGNVTLTDSRGNTSAAYPYNSITRRIDANTPSITNFTIPNTTMKLGDKVTCTITVVSDTGNYILNSGTVAGYPIDSIKKNTDNQYLAYFTVTSLGYDIEAGQSHSLQNLVLSDYAGNSSTPYSKIITQTNDPIYTVLPTAKVTGKYHICEGDSVALKMEFTGRSPWNIEMKEGATTSIINGITATPYYYKVKAVNSTGLDADTLVYKINQVTDFTGNTRIYTTTDSAIVYVHLVPNAVITYPAGNRIYNISTASDTLIGNYSNGIFTGTGVISSRKKFYPPEAGVGVYDIIYRYTTPHGCSDSDSLVFTVINASGVIHFPDHSPKNDFLYCDYENAFTVIGENINSKIGTFAIEGYSGAALINNFDNTATIDPKQLAAGTYTLIYTYNDEGIVNIPEQFTIESVSPLINFTDVGNHCSDYDTIKIEAANLFPIGGIGNYTFSDPTSGALVYNPIDSKNNKAFLLPDSIAPGIYNLKYYYITPSGCSSDTITKNFEIYDLPTVSFTMNSVYNIDQGVTLISGNPLGSTGVFTPLSFMLNNGNGTANFDPQVAGLGNHTVVYSYTDGNGCKNLASKPISVTKAQGFLKGLDYYISGTDTMYQYCYYGYDIDTVVGYSFNGDGTPGSFFINGQIVPSIGKDSIEFNPQNYGSGNHIIRYAYNNGPTSYYFEKTINIDSIGEVDFVGFVDNYCEYNNSQVQLTAVNPIGNIGSGVFSGNGVAGSKFTPSLAQLGENIINYLFTRTYSGCKKEVSHIINVNKKPAVNFHVDDYCFIDPTDSIAFYSDTLATDSVIIWRWVFDNSITSSLPNLKKSYTTPGFKEIRLEVETNKGCVNSASKYLKFDLKPEVFFSWGNECFGGETKFTDQTENEDPLNIYSWDFNDDSLSNLRHPMHMFSDTGQYFVKLSIKTSTGCISEKSQAVNIRPSIRLSDKDYFQDFESGQGGWIAELISNSVSWEYGTPAKEIINSASSGSHAWVTQLTGNYSNNEQSMITSPCFIFEDIKRPMIKIDYLSQTEKDRDGVVIQFSDTLGGWKTIGIPGEGVNWYNSYVINGSPANQQLGWTGAISNEWQTGKFILDELVGRSTVRFRIVFGSDAAAADEGFAFDNIWIGERQRVVLLEHFTNPNDATSNTIQNNTIMPIVTDNPLDILNLNYQMSYPTANSLNAFYPSGPSARSLFYGVSRVPYSVIDGSHRQFNYLAGNNFTETDLHRRVLEDPKFKIEIEQELQGANYAVSAKLKALDDLTDIRINAQIALVERTVNYNGNKYYNVLRTLLPDPAGTLIERNWLTDDSTFVQHIWPVQSGVNTDSLIVIIFVQDADSKEVYQTAFSGDLSTITAIEDLLIESDNDITIYPNPASTEINILTNLDHKADLQLYLYNSIGVLIKSELIKKEDNFLTIPTSDLQAGIYYLKFIGDKGYSRSHKLIIAK